ncbi:hypothetical protein [Chlamydia buteonis]|uniref:Uncharacterized protein n=1 Tax=Chlamydia buteonis TaxID=2494525 RepID=A0ABX8LCT7_9CHLA|nr:hypothetical protein [Chlamydia buteonis]QXE26572.1 hypothetical protein HBN95_00170 [Chlamydia buteonis]QXE27606.1 hypothetical protein JJJ19_02975 [Chlamydia buteonis]
MLSSVDTQELSNATTESPIATQTTTEPSPQHPPKVLSGSLVIYPSEDNKPAS